MRTMSGWVRLHCFEGLSGVGGLADDFHPLSLREDLPGPGPEQRMIVDYDDPDRWTLRPL